VSPPQDPRLVIALANARLLPAGSRGPAGDLGRMQDLVFCECPSSMLTGRP
jgi:hypothetical protein